MTTPGKRWIVEAVQALRESLHPVPHETNEIDWKVRLSDKKDRLTEHLIAFANHPNGGYLAFGVSDGDGHLEAVDKDTVAQIANTLANLGRDAVEPPVSIDHAVVEYEDTPILLVRIPSRTPRCWRPGVNRAYSWRCPNAPSATWPTPNLSNHSKRRICYPMARKTNLEILNNQ